MKITRIALPLLIVIGSVSPFFINTALGAGPCTWAGTTDANWSTASNWSGTCSGTGGIPGSGDALVFPAGAANVAMTDDLGAASFDSLTFNTDNYSLAGADAITIGAGGLSVVGGTQTMNIPLTFGAAGTVTSSANGQVVFKQPIDIGANTLTITAGDAGTSGALFLAPITSVAGAAVHKLGDGDLHIDADNLTGNFDLDIAAGSVSNDNSCAADACNLPQNQTVTIESSGVLVFGTPTKMGALAGAGTLILDGNNAQINQTHDTTFTGDITGTAGGQVMITGDSAHVLTINNPAGLSYPGEIAVAQNGIAKLDSTIATANADILDTGTLELSGSTVGIVKVGATAGTTKTDGILVLDGPTMNNAGQITLQNNSKLESTITSATNFGQVTTTATPDISAGTIGFAAAGAYVPVAGDAFPIIINSSATPTSVTNGTFLNLPQGGQVTFNGIGLDADYTAATNSEFVLTASTTAATTTPVSGPLAVTSIGVATNPITIGTSTVLHVDFTDTDASSTHSVIIDWGDGSATSSVADAEIALLDSGIFEATSTHTYAATSTFAITATVFSSTNGTTTATTTQTVQVVPVVVTPPVVTTSSVGGGGGVIGGPLSYGYQNGLGTVGSLGSGAIIPTGSTATTGIPAGSVLGAQTYHFTSPLKYGSRGADVTELQRILIADNFLHISAPTGWFGPMTLAAVKQYQAQESISQTGYVGTLTLAALNAGETVAVK